MRSFTALVLILPAFAAAAPRSFTIEQVLSAPFPTSLTAAPKGGAVAWVLDEKGARNIWVATAPAYKGRRLTAYTADDGQEIADLAWAPDGAALYFVRGGDFEMRRGNPNPASLAEGVEQSIWTILINGGAPRKIGDGNEPAVSPQGDRVVFLRKDEIWSVGLKEGDKPAQLLHARGTPSHLRWSPDGTRIVYVSGRGDHSFAAVYDFRSKALRYLDPSLDEDSSPVWSPDGRQVAFVRVPASVRAFRFGPVRTAEPWSIRVADAESGKGHELWRASDGPGSAFSGIVSDDQIFWGADGRIVFPWEKTGWRKLYASGGGPAAPLGDNGDFEVEHVSLTRDRRSLLVSSNEADVDRRHLWRVPVSGEKASEVTLGNGVEWSPYETSEGAIVMLHSDATHPARAAILEGRGEMRDLAPDSIPTEFPASALVTPQSVVFTSADGMPIHGQLFLPADGGKHAALMFLHGGSRRQMMPGFHYMDYYHNAYAMNQYLANAGFVVLAINYRSGIGYGMNFREALNYGAAGASEFNDVMGAGLYLRGRPDVDAKRIGLWGGSYGGYLTALGLARASDLFAAGVDFHGVHDWNNVIRNFVPAYDPGKDANAARIAFESSPMSSIATWRSPVLLIHGDDDRNVPFHESIVLVEALRKQHVPVEQLVFPDEVHGFLTHRRWLEAYQATAEFLAKYLR